MFKIKVNKKKDFPAYLNTLFVPKSDSNKVYELHEYNFTNDSYKIGEKYIKNCLRVISTEDFEKNIKVGYWIIVQN